MKISLKDKPFCLSDARITWVEETLASLTVKRMGRDSFCGKDYLQD